MSSTSKAHRISRRALLFGRLFERAPDRTPALAHEPSPPARAELHPEARRRMGKAQIQPYACLAHNRSFCSTCVERCPVPGAIVVEAGRPRVVADLCDACGVCAEVCPAPVNAIAILPELER